MCQNAHFQWIRYFLSFQLIPTPIFIILTLCIHSGYSENAFHMQNSSIWTFHKFACLDRKSHRFHRSVIWADNCQILSFISNKTFHFSAFPPSDVQLFALENFRVENYRFRKIAQNVIFGPPDLKMHESASHHFAWTLPAQPRQTWRLQPGSQIQTACRAQTAWPGPTRLTSYRKRWTAISSHF